jgi:hypothetical protein
METEYSINRNELACQVHSNEKNGVIMEIEFKWEHLTNNTDRVKVYQGWIIR